MPRISIYQVDAFSSQVFGGNPAAVVPLDQALDDRILQAIAAENNLSETAFIMEAGTHFQLRWFTPTTEVPLCGHATLASAWVIFNYLWPDLDQALFATLSGELRVRELDDGWLELDFPKLACRKLEQPPQALLDGLGIKPAELFVVEGDSNYLALLESAEAVQQLVPDIASLKTLEKHGLIVTAPGRDGDCDFVSRYFAPAFGIDEDPVTGSIHCALTPFWRERLGREQLLARQLSRRGGELRCQVHGDRVMIAGQVAPYLRGEIELDDTRP